MKKLVLSFLVICSLLLVSCGTPSGGIPPASPESNPVPPVDESVSPPPSTPQSPDETEPNLQPQTIAQWQGTGIKTTEPFTIDYAPWGIKWTHTPQIIEGESVGILQIFVYNIENPDIPVTLAANSMAEETDTSWVYETGTFYLTINAANTSWVVLVAAMVEQ